MHIEKKNTKKNKRIVGFFFFTKRFSLKREIIFYIIKGTTYISVRYFYLATFYRICFNRSQDIHQNILFNNLFKCISDHLSFQRLATKINFYYFTY